MSEQSKYQNAAYNRDIHTVPAPTRTNLRKHYWAHPSINCFMTFGEWLDKIGYTKGLPLSERIYLSKGIWRKDLEE